MKRAHDDDSTRATKRANENGDLVSAADRLGDSQDATTVAARCDNQLVSLSHLLPACGSIVPVAYTEPEGARVYKRTLVTLLGAAVQRCGLGPLSIEASIGASLNFSLPGVPTAATTKMLTGMSHSLMPDALWRVVVAREPLRSRLCCVLDKQILSHDACRGDGVAHF